MTELTIEFLELDDSKKSHILINGENLCEYSYCYAKKWLYVYDEKLFNALLKYKVTDLLKYFDVVEMVNEQVDSIWLEFSIRSKGLHYYSQDSEPWASAKLKYDPEEWNKAWTIKQYLNTYHDKVKIIDDAELACEIADEDENTGKPIYDLYNGIGVGVPVDDQSISLKSLYNKVSEVCCSINSEVERELVASINEAIVERCIEFPPEYHQAGLGILNYFGTYLREQYSEENARVKIEQQGLHVRMVIQTEDGKLETIEKALHEYELIVLGSEPPERFSKSDKLVLELRNELRIAQFRLESQQDLIGMQNGRIDQLLNIVSNGLSQKHQVAIDFKPEISLTNSVTINQDIATALSNVNELKEELTMNEGAYLAFSELESSLTEIESEVDPASVRRSSAMSKFKRLVDKVVDEGSDLNLAITKVESGWEIFKELAGKYNKVAEWCGLPIIPSTLIK